MKIEIKVPESLKDIKLSQHQKFLRAVDGVEDESLIARYMVECYCDLPESIVKNMTKQSFNEIVVSINKIFDKKEFELIPTFKMGGIEYGFVPNLDELTVGETADVDTFLKDWQKMDKAMSVLYRPINKKKGGKYLIQEYEGAHSLDVSLDVAFGSYFFLSNLLIDLLSCIPKYIADQVKADQRLLTLVENGDGFNQFTDSLEGIFLNLKMSLN